MFNISFQFYHCFHKDQNHKQLLYYFNDEFSASNVFFFFIESSVQCCNKSVISHYLLHASIHTRLKRIKNTEHDNNYKASHGPIVVTRCTTINEKVEKKPNGYFKVHVLKNSEILDSFFLFYINFDKYLSVDQADFSNFSSKCKVYKYTQ